MEEEKQPEGVPTPAVSEEKPEVPLSRSYAEDLAHAMQATDAKTVQELLTLAREKETVITEAEEEQKTNWVFILGAMLCFAAVGIACWFIWNRYQDTRPVPIERTYSQAVFSQLSPIDSSKTDIREVVRTLQTTAPLSFNTPTIVPLVTASSSEPLAPSAFFTFIEGEVPPSLLSAITAVRLGGIATGDTVIPFIIITGTDQGALTQELRTAEPTLVRTFYRALGITIAAAPELLTASFQDEYISNISVRTIHTGNINTPSLVYGFISDESVVITTNTAAFARIYDVSITAR